MSTCGPYSGCGPIVRVYIRLGRGCVLVCCLCEFGPVVVGFCPTFSKKLSLFFFS
jgi:hypothetical protein